MVFGNEISTYELPDHFHFRRGGGLTFSQLKSEVRDNFHFQKGGALWSNFWSTQIWSPIHFRGVGLGRGALWTNIPLTREGFSVKFGHKFCAQKTACASQIVSHLPYTTYVETNKRSIMTLKSSSIFVLVFSSSQQKWLSELPCMWTCHLSTVTKE